MRKNGKNFQSVIIIFTYWRFPVQWTWLACSSFFFKGSTQHSWDWFDFEAERKTNNKLLLFLNSTHVPCNVQDMDPSHLMRVCVKKGKLKRSSLASSWKLCLVYTLFNFIFFSLLMSPLFRIKWHNNNRLFFIRDGFLLNVKRTLTSWVCPYLIVAWANTCHAMNY